MAPLPPPNPAEGRAASEQAAQARRTALHALTMGQLTLQALFELVEAEWPKHQLGHIHVRAALEALPHIGEVRSARILTDLGIPYTEHLDVLGPIQRERLLEETGADV